MQSPSQVHKLRTWLHTKWKRCNFHLLNDIQIASLRGFIFQPLVVSLPRSLALDGFGDGNLLNLQHFYALKPNMPIATCLSCIVLLNCCFSHGALHVPIGAWHFNLWMRMREGVGMWHKQSEQMSISTHLRSDDEVSSKTGTLNLQLGVCHQVVLHTHYTWLRDLWNVPTYAVEKRIAKVQGLTPCFCIFIAILQLFQLWQACVLACSRVCVVQEKTWIVYRLINWHW
jgi:hypothetical protein